MKKYRVQIIFLLFIFYIALFTTQCKEDGEDCKINADCNSTFCENEVGDCNGDGTCQTRPDSEDCTETGSPVCGCDGSTYDSECLAHVSGINVASEGACEGGETCTDNADCSSGEYCDKDTGNCSSEGTCETKPDSGSCTDTSSPVCGCDGSTYDSECLAHVSGINVASEGACEGGETCTDNADCPEGSGDDYNCKKTEGDCEGTGTCVKAPDSCDPGEDPVC